MIFYVNKKLKFSALFRAEVNLTQSAWAAQYTDCISVGKTPTTSVLLWH